MTVFVVQEASHDLSPALAFGDLFHVNRYYIHGDELEYDVNCGGNVIPPGYRANIDRAVDKFNPATDFLLIYGDHLQLLALTAKLAARHGSFQVLRWDRKISSYIPVWLHSGLVPPPSAVIASGTNIGEIDAKDREEWEKPGEVRFVSHQELEAPLQRRDPRKRAP